MRQVILAAAGVLCVCAGGGALQVNCAHAQAYPVKPVRMVVAYPPGGPNDIVGRAVAQKLTELLGQSVIVDNRSGAGGNVGTDTVAKAPADGYTLLMGAGAMTIAPSLYPKLPYDVVRDFAPVSQVATTAFVLLLHPAVPARSVTELIDLARKRPAALNCASSGLGAPPHLAAELFQSMTATKLNHVPYKGATPALIDLVGGQVDLYFGGIASAFPHIQAGRLRGLAVTNRKRSVTLPNVPTMDEAGLKGFDVSTWFGILAPADTSRDVVSRLHAATIKVVASPDVRGKLQLAGVEPESSTPEQFAIHIKDEIAKFGALVRASGAKAE